MNIISKALGSVGYSKCIFDITYCLHHSGHKNKEKKGEKSEERKVRRKEGERMLPDLYVL